MHHHNTKGNNTMKLFTPPANYTTFVNEDNYQEISIDKIFDALENALDDLEDARDNLRDGIIYNSNNASVSVKSPTRRREEIRRGEELWQQLVNDNEAKYFVLGIDEHIFDEHPGVNTIIRSIYKLKPVTFIRESIKIDYDSLKYVAVKEVGTPEDCLFPAKAWVYYKPEIRISETPDCEATAQMKNETYRIFRCKDCGRFVEISRGYDEHLISWGMKPFQRCEFCRKNASILTHHGNGR